MRQIGSIEDRQQAENFVAYLISKNILSSCDGGAPAWRIWIQEEDNVATAKDDLTQFLADPNHERYRNATNQAQQVLRERAKRAKEISQRTIDLRNRWQQPTVNNCPITVGLLAIMTLLIILQKLDPQKFIQVYLLLTFSPDGTANAIRAGEVWRLITPIFMHGGFLHFIFNAMALRDLGLVIETRMGSAKYLGMILVIAAVSDSAEHLITHHPFVGMSGVVYGLFGYAWIRGRLEPDCGLSLPRNVVYYMMGWFFLCMLVIPGIANWVHAGGLVTGALFGTISPTIRALRRR